MVNFNEFGLEQTVLRAINDMGFEEATHIQEKTIPFVLRGKDVIGQAQTGTGKTAAFGIPLVQRLVSKQEHIQGLVITPTRELAIQVAVELNKIGQFKGIRSLPVYGGQEISRQIRALKQRPEIVVATPGRLLDHLRRKTIRLNFIKMVVIDEADEMLDMGFIEDIEAVLKALPEGRQMLLFSATMPRAIQLLAERFMREPKLFLVQPKEIMVPSIEQYYVEVEEKQKFDVLCRLLDIQSPELTIVFARTKKRVDELSEALNKRGYEVEGIHGDLSQGRRSIVLNSFKEGRVDVLVATDVAARGLDISGVTHVFNFDIPQDPESYVHRVGRTGRVGKKGVAVTLVTPREMHLLRTIESVTKHKIEKKAVPTLLEAKKGLQRLAVEKLVEVVEHGHYQANTALAEELLEEHDSVTLLAAALKMLTKEPDETRVELTEEPVFGNRRKKLKNKNRALSPKNRNMRKDGKPMRRANKKLKQKR